VGTHALRRGHAGFTLLELVFVLVLLGVLAAIAIPRFVDISDSARRATVSATAGAFASAVLIANVGCAIRGWQGKDNLPGYGDGKVDFNSTCFPTDTTGNANTIGNNNARCMRVWNGILASPPAITTSNTGADYRARARKQVCTYQYLLTTTVNRQFTYDSRTGAIVVTNP